MSDLTIYDSQGQPFSAAESPRSDDRIKDFFFDGVRFALDMKLANEAVVFFRARDNETARSEQYYAVYKFERRSELPRLGDEIRRVIEDQEGMILDTSKDDTDIFQLLVGDRSDERQDIRAPGDRSVRDDLLTLLDDQRNLQVGVDSYRSACGVFNEFASEPDISQIAIADTASSSRLEGYDLVIEVGSYSGIEPLGSTADHLERLREKRRKRRQTDLAGGSAAGGPIGRLVNADTWVVDIAFAIIVVAVLLTGGVYGACAFNFGPQGTLSSVPVLGEECGASPSVQIDSASYDESTDAFLVNGSVGNGTTPLNATFTVSNASSNESVSEQSVLGTGTFNETVENNGTLQPRTDVNYSITMRTNRSDPATYNLTIGQSGSATRDRSTGTATPTGTATATPAGTATATGTATETLTPIPTTESTATPGSTPTPEPTPTATATATSESTPTAGSTPTATATATSSSSDGGSSSVRPVEDTGGSPGLLPAGVVGLVGLAAISITTRSE